MGLFLHQVRTLFWKNWLCRVRQSILFLSEILWPCTLFLILAAVRSYEPPVHVKNCYLEPRNLPSHGVFPFIQSLLCNAGSRCKDMVFSSEDSDSNSLWNLEEDIMKIEETGFKEIQDLSKDVLEITEKFSNLHNIWAEVFNFSSSADLGFILGYLNLTESVLFNAEKIQTQMSFWDVATLPWPNDFFMKTNSPSKLVFSVDEFLKIFEIWFKQSVKALKAFPSLISDHVNNLNSTIELFISMQNWIFKDIRHILYRWNALQDVLAFSDKEESLFYSDIELHEKQINFLSLLHKIFPHANTSNYLQKLFITASEIYISLINDTSSVNGDPQKEQYVLSNILRHLARYFEDAFAEFDETQFEDKTEIFSDVQIALEKLESRKWIKTFIQLSDIVRSHVNKLLNIRKEAFKYVQVVAQLLKFGSMDHSQVNGVISRITQMLLNVNHGSCEDFVDFLKITFKIQDVLFPKDTKLLLCSYYKSFDLENISNKSESISEIRSVERSLAKKFTGWQEIHHLLQEDISLSYNLSNTRMTDTFLLQNISSLLRYIFDELAAEMGKSPSWKNITELIKKACISNKINPSGVKHTNVSCFAVLCLVKNYSSAMFLDTFLECLENLKIIFPEILDMSSQDNHTEGYAYFKNLLHIFSEISVYNCSVLFDQLNELNQDFSNPRYNRSKRTDVFTVVLEKILEHTLKMSVQYRCLNYEKHLPHLGPIPSFTNVLKNIFSKVHFENHLHTLQTSVTKLRTEVAKQENDFGDVKSLLNLVEKDLTEFYIQTHFINLFDTEDEIKRHIQKNIQSDWIISIINKYMDLLNISTSMLLPIDIFPRQSENKDDILKEIMRNIQNNIQSDWIIPIINKYMDLLNISTSMLLPIDIFPRRSENKDDFLSENIFSSEELSNTTRCHVLIQSTLTAFMQSILSRNIIGTINDTLLLYSNISVENSKTILSFVKKCLPEKTLQKLLLNLNSDFLDIEDAHAKITLVDYLKLHCDLSTLDSSLLLLLDNNQAFTSISILNRILQHSMYNFLENSLTGISFYSSFDTVSMKPVCGFLEVLPMHLDKNMTLEDINIFLLNYVNDLHESVAEENITSGHGETALFFIISRFAVQNLSYAHNLCTLLKFPYYDFPNTSNSNDFVLDTDLRKATSINLLCEMVSKAANIELLLGEYLIFLNRLDNFTARLPYFAEESILNISAEISMNIIQIFDKYNNAITIQEEEAFEKGIFAEVERLINIFTFTKVFKLLSKSKIDILIKNIYNAFYKIKHKGLSISKLKQITSYFLLNKNSPNLENILLFWINNITRSIDAETRNDTGTSLLFNSSNESNNNLLEVIMGTYSKLLDDFRKDEKSWFFLRFINEIIKHINTENPALEKIILLIKSLLINSAKNFTFQDFHFDTSTNGYHGMDPLTQLMNSSLLLSKALFSISQLSSEFPDRKIMTSFMEYLQDGLLNNKNLSDICPLLYEKLDVEDFTLLHEFQRTLRNILSFLSDNPQYFTENICIISKCNNSSAGILISLIDLINLLSDKFKDVQNPMTDFDDCTRFTLTSKQLFDIFVNFTNIIQNASNKENCLCNTTMNHVQQQKLMLKMKNLITNSTAEKLFNNTIFHDLTVGDILQNSSRFVSEVNSLTNISVEAANLTLRMEVFKLQHFFTAIGPSLAGNCTEDILSLLLQFTTEKEASIVTKELCDVSPVELYKMIVLIIQNINVRNLVYKIGIPPEMEILLHMFLNYTSKIVTFFDKYQQVFASSKFLQNLSPVIIDFHQNFEALSVKPSLLYLQSLTSTLCKEGPLFFNDITNFIDNVKVSDTVNLDIQKYGIPENSTPFCLQLYQDILQSSNGIIKWTFLKPLLHGKILYTPDVPETMEIINKANRTFSILEKIKNFSEVWLTMSAILKSSNQLLSDPTLQMLLRNSFLNNYSESQLNLSLGEFVKKLKIYEYNYAKMLNNSVVQKINFLSQFMVNISSCLCFNRFLPFNTSDTLEEQAKGLIQKNDLLAGILFNLSFSKESAQKHHLNGKLPSLMKYTIRTNALYSMKTGILKNPLWRSHPRRLPGSGITYNHVFAPIQDMIDRAIISVHTGMQIFEPEVQVQAMPYPCHTRDLFLNHIGFFFPLIMMMSWIISVASMVRKLVYEKEIHLEEYMKMMGVNGAANFLAWLLENIGIVTINSFIIVFILKLSGILVYSNGIIIFLFFLEFGISVIMFSFLVSVFFNKANTAALCGSILYMLNFLPYIILLVLQKQISFATQCLMCLLSTIAFGQGIFLITAFESEGTGIQWNNLCQAEAEAMPFLWICGMIPIDSIMYFVLGWYIGNIMPGSVGQKKPWNFPFTVTYWKQDSQCKQSENMDRSTSTYRKDQSDEGSLHQGQSKTFLPLIENGVSLVSVSKLYSNNLIAVKDLSFRFYANEITSILGSNGAGKTTILSMLSSLYLPTSGKIFVNGRDMQTQLMAIRMELGVCPQYDVLFDYLTVKEHLMLFGALKMPSWTNSQLKREVEQSLQEVGLLMHQKKCICSLSGGMKRRLSVAMAFIGGAKTVVLDEPTSGVDPCSRRFIWNILQKNKNDRTIIFTTHNMDEADYLSDRIVIIQQGRIKCCGSPSSLKEKYTQGYELTLTKQKNFKNATQVTSLVRDCIPSAILRENSSTELVYEIHGKVDAMMYNQLFLKLNKNLLALQISGYGITGTTMEQVFLKSLQDGEHILTQETVLDVDLANCKSNNSNENMRFNSTVTNKKTMRRIQLYLSQISALLIYSFHHTRRDWRGSLANLVLPILFVTMAMGMFNLKPFSFNHLPLKLSSDLYGNEQALFFSTDSSDSNSFPEVIARHFGSQNTTCIYSSMNISCLQSVKKNHKMDPCRDIHINESCPVSGVLLPFLRHGKTCTMYNLSGFSAEELLLTLIIKDSYGGWSFTRKADTNGKNKFQAKVWYSQKGYHTLPAYLNYLNNIILWKNLPADANWKQYGITVFSKPYQGTMMDEDKILENVRQCGVALCITLGFSILTASIGSGIVKEYQSGAKCLQHISGLDYKIYWISHFIYNMAFYLVAASLCVCVIASFHIAAFTLQENLAATALLLILFGYATFPWMYLVSGFFPSSDVAFISYISTNCTLGVCTMLLTFLPQLLAEISNIETFTDIHNILKWVFLIFPQFCLGNGLMEFTLRQVKFDLINSFGIDFYISPFQMDVLGWTFSAMAIQGSILFLLRLVLNGHSFQRKRQKSPLYDLSEDIDVETERGRVLGGMTPDDKVLLYNLRKSYQNNIVVKDICLGIEAGECFGLLGVNGAGKSTLFKMLIGEINPTSGKAIIRSSKGKEVCIKSAYNEDIIIGYCPQNDAMNNFLTGREHLYYYCKLRGISNKDINKTSSVLSHRLDFDDQIDKLVGTYSRGTKRKLSMAIALIGKPQILLLDEPSSGMDPWSKRHLWEVIKQEVHDGCATIFTSHSMEECEALCTRLAIMINGNLKCVGPLQHIKNRFGCGYSLTLWLNADNDCAHSVITYFKSHFPEVNVKGHHLNILEFHLPSQHGCLNKLFQVLDNMKRQLQIKNYSVTQTTLDQVFIQFAAQQEQYFSPMMKRSVDNHRQQLPA